MKSKRCCVKYTTYDKLDKAYIRLLLLDSQRGGEVRLLRTRSSRRAHNPQISSSNLLPATLLNIRVAKSCLQSLRD